jgi:hypothetical protein
MDKLPKEELSDIYRSPGIDRIMKSRRLKWDGHVASREKQGMHGEFWWRPPGTCPLFGRQKEIEDNIKIDFR